MRFAEGRVTPPTDLAAPDAAALYTVVIGVAFAAIGVWCVVVAVRRHDPTPVLVLVSGLLAVGFEPVVDTLGLVWYARDNPWVAYTALDVPQPVFLLLGYSFFWGGVVYATYRLLLAGVGPWRLFAAVVVMDLVVEILGVKVLDVGTYYGAQPFRVAGFPLWWAPVNGTVAVVGGRLLVYLVPRLRGWRRLGLLAVSPAAFAGTHGVSAWPTWVALGSDVPGVVVWIAATLTMALAAGLVAFVRSTLPPAEAPG